jgi:LacI family transcriptional regulator, galactose operon repressor
MTSRTIAALSGVSQTTVSRVLSNHPNVSETTRARVLSVLEQTDYAPNAAARAMRTGLTGVIGVVAGAVTNPFYPELVDALNAAISRRGLQMSLWIASDGSSRMAGERAALAAVRQGALDGVIFTTVTARSPALRAALERRAAIVLMNRTLNGAPVDCVSTDNVAGAAEVASYFVAHGKRRPAIIVGPKSVSTSSEREEGFRRGLRAAGVELASRHIIRGDFTHPAGCAAMHRLLEDEPPDAVFCVNDAVAFGAIDAARDAGVAIPDDLWVVGFDDTELASWPAFNLTTVRQSTDELAEVGVDLLLGRLRDRDGPRDVRRLRAELIVRRSTGYAPPLPI